MTKQQQYFRELKSLIDSEVTLDHFNADFMRSIIDKAMGWSRTQTILKRPPKTDARLIYYIACESWLERLLESDLHSRFKSTQAIDDYALRVLSQAGWGANITGYDTAWVRLMTEFKPRIREWWAQSHETDNRTVERIGVLTALERLDVKDEWVGEKINELKEALINGKAAE
jgi:hypothetical protein